MHGSRTKASLWKTAARVPNSSDRVLARRGYCEANDATTRMRSEMAGTVVFLIGAALVGAARLLWRALVTKRKRD
jgi:hypothetical protein